MSIFIYCSLGRTSAFAPICPALSTSSECAGCRDCHTDLAGSPTAIGCPSPDAEPRALALAGLMDGEPLAGRLGPSGAMPATSLALAGRLSQEAPGVARRATGARGHVGMLAEAHRRAIDTSAIRVTRGGCLPQRQNPQLWVPGRRPGSVFSFGRLTGHVDRLPRPQNQTHLTSPLAVSRRCGHRREHDFPFGRIACLVWLLLT
jgi:hypothetical protein